jgi:hypothetical protein
MYVEYSSNNSGGSWWLKDAAWRALEDAGWIVEWCALTPDYDKKGEYKRRKDGIPKFIKRGTKKCKYDIGKPDKDGRWLGALAKTAYKPNCSSLRAAADEWEKITGACATDAGCACCGKPHNFTLYDNKGKYIESGPHASYEAHWD